MKKEEEKNWSWFLFERTYRLKVAEARETGKE